MQYELSLDYFDTEENFFLCFISIFMNVYSEIVISLESVGSSSSLPHDKKYKFWHQL